MKKEKNKGKEEKLCFVQYEGGKAEKKEKVRDKIINKMLNLRKKIVFLPI